MRVPAGRAEVAMAEACDALGTGCLEHPEADGQVVLEFWTEPQRTESAAAALRGWGEVDDPEPQDPWWRDAMRAFHVPVEVAGRLLVRPPWTPPRDGWADVVIDPGMAFGTGQHDTTRGCLELMVDVPRGSLVDVGCGSGVLAIAARRLGFDPVTAWDHDPLSVDATLANARANGVALTVACRDLTVQAPPAADVMVANLTASLLVTVAAVIRQPARRAVLSGMRPAEVPGVLDAFSAHGYVRTGTRETDGWASVLVERS